MRTKRRYAMMAMLLAGVSVAVGSDERPMLNLESIVAVQTADGKRSLAALTEVQQRQTKPAIIQTAFVAVVTTTAWPEGLVPVFAIERENGSYELRRTPAQGMESFTDPLFFALPREEETEATKIAGVWHCTATNRNGGTHTVTWQLTANEDRIAGRFDPQTEYRVANIIGGTFRSNRFELTVEYSNDRYLLRGAWRAGTMEGRWEQEGGDDGGGWHATRPARQSRIPDSSDVVALYEWIRTGTQERCYLPENEKPGAGWTRTEGTLCRIWGKAPRRSQRRSSAKQRTRSTELGGT